jgi:prephenate dehydrogenase
VVTDAASTKQSIVESIGDSGLGDLFVGSHPMAGSEKTGPEAADPDLFQGRLVVVTPTGETAVQRTEIVERFWESLGARTLQMDPAVHDEAVANASHLPHVLASALAATANERALSVVGTGWLDTTRIAAGDAELWRQILMDNRSRIIAEIDKLSGVLMGFRQALADSNDAELIRLLQQGKERRDAVGN